ncbi:hypothetical protein [Streptomyces sp. TLI_171]|uniref:ATP-dependent DNA ligase n=1 Tax=Streptomyces sp. TLI_171 TaxID=1938859 RepID=UPI000C43B5BD|nr:hypothetical protein [Streptomyces sp. TLI_171]RKE02886.1 ATP-dependent DNA ligase [Streptomyces sp. TLI_171]
MTPFPLPIEVALAAPIEALPEQLHGEIAQAKWDGWRAIVRTGPSARIWSRHGTDLTRPFADVAAEAEKLPVGVLDGELLAVTATGEVLFSRLQTRAGKGPRSGADFTVQFAAFDALAAGEQDLRREPLTSRLGRLAELLDGGPRAIWPLPSTTDLDEATGWVGAVGGAVEGLVLKPKESPYLSRYGSRWRKWRERHPVDAVVVGITVSDANRQAAVLAQPDPAGRLRTVGVSLPLTPAQRAELAPLLRPAGDGRVAELPGTVGGLPGAPPVAYLPVEPDVVVEILVDQARPEFGRYRHRPRLVRVRADLQPAHLMLPGPVRRS